MRIRLLPREFSALWRAICARWRRRGRDNRNGDTNVAQARAQRSSTKILHDSSLPITTRVGSCQASCFKRMHARKSIVPRVLTRTTSTDAASCSLSTILPVRSFFAFAFYVRSRVTSGALHELDDLLTVARSIRATPWRSPEIPSNLSIARSQRHATRVTEGSRLTVIFDDDPPQLEMVGIAGQGSRLVRRHDDAPSASLGAITSPQRR